MSDQSLATVLIIECLLIAVLAVVYFFNYRREWAAWLIFVIFLLYAGFFYLLGGGVSDPVRSTQLVYADVRALVFAQLALIVILFFRAGERG